MSQQSQHFTIEVPQWVSDYIKDIDCIPEQEARAAFVIEASRLNIQHKTGGPFAAGIFEQASGKLISLGVNLVTTQNYSVLHAEVMAIMLAQNKLGTYDLSQGNQLEHELLSSAEPCAMCFGAIPWSGVTRLVSCAEGHDACEIGFDEGDKPEHWEESLRKRGLSVETSVLREQARDVLQEYGRSGEIYNSREGE